MDIEYLMENPEESIRLEIKTDPEAVKKQALWCGLKPGIRVLDAGCGPGRVTSILNDMIQPGGEIVGVDYSDERISYANKHYIKESEIFFRVHDLRHPLNDFGLFDLIWVRFVLEYNRSESHEIIKNLSACLKPGGHLCLLDLDSNCLTHFELPVKMEAILRKLMKKLEQDYNFDAYAGRKLYSYIYDLGYEDIRLDLTAHHLFYGEIREEDVFNWLKKLEVASNKAKELFKDYPRGREAYLKDFNKFFLDPRRFTYTPLIICRGSKPLLFR
ncbi:class I SAM-dependent methyltransferase [Thermodesulfobacteriota bacterium]